MGGNKTGKDKYELKFLLLSCKFTFKVRTSKHTTMKAKLKRENFSLKVLIISCSTFPPPACKFPPMASLILLTKLGVSSQSFQVIVARFWCIGMHVKSLNSSWNISGTMSIGVLGTGRISLGAFFLRNCSQECRGAKQTGLEMLAALYPSSFNSLVNCHRCGHNWPTCITDTNC